jgi:hypothetical protein
MVHYIKKAKIILYFEGRYCYVKQVNIILEEYICCRRKRINLKNRTDYKGDKMNKRINKIIAILLSIVIVFANQTVVYGGIEQQDNEDYLEGYENLNIDEDLDISKFATPSIASFRMASLLNTGGGFTRRTTAPESWNNYYYNAAYNPYTYETYVRNADLIGECTWYVWGRAYEILGYRPNISNRYAKDFYAYNLNSGAYPYGNEPKLGAIACFAPHNHADWTGHVAIVEAVGGDGSVILSEYNFVSRHAFSANRYLNPTEARTWVQGYIYLRPDDPVIPDHIPGPVGGSDDDIADGDYTIRSDVAEGRSLGWEGDGNTNGQNVCLKDYFKNGDYVWTLERQSDDSFIVKTKQGGKLLDILGGPYSYGNEKNAIMWDYVQGNDNQRWYIVRNGGGYRFIAKHSGYSLDVRNGDATDGNNIYQYYPNESTAQRFYLEKHDFPNVEETSANDLKDNATYIIRSKLDVSKVITSESDSSGANGKNIYLNDYNSPNLPSTQIWKLEKQSDGTFLIKNTFNNKYMDVVWYSLSNRANIYSWERHYNPSESWYIVKNNDTEGTYRIVNKNSGKVVDITGGQTANGTNVQQYIWHEHPAQMFFFERVPATIEYTVTFKTDDNYIVSTQIVEEGNPAFAPQAPDREGYEFVDWEGDYSNILSDTVIIAKYNKLPENNNVINTGNNNNTAPNTGSSSNNTANFGNNVVNNTGTNSSTSNGGNNTGGSNLNIGNGNNIAGTNAGNTNSNTGNNIGNTATDTTKKSKGGSSSGGGGGSRSGGGGGGGSRSGGSGGSRSGGSAAKSSQNSTSMPQGSISWQRDNKGWWIKNSDGSYPRNEWKLVNNSWYFFDSQGYMFTGWLNSNGSWYYMNTDEGSDNGKMVTGWRVVSGKWYYLSTATDGSGGKMLLNTIIDGYRLGADGAWVK